MIETPLPVFCSIHPEVETTLRCNRCEKPICPKCAVATPTGYRCKECVRGQQKIFETALAQDYILGGIVAAILAFIGARIIPFMFFFTIILSPIAGVIIAEATRAITKKRRSRRLYLIITLAALAGCLPDLLLDLFFSLMALSQGGFSSLLSLLWQAVYTFMVTSTVYYRLTGIQIKV